MIKLAKNKAIAAILAALLAIILLLPFTAKVTMRASAASQTNVFAGATLDVRYTYTRVSGDDSATYGPIDKGNITPYFLSSVDGIGLDRLLPDEETEEHNGATFELSKVSIRVNFAKPFQWKGEDGYSLLLDPLFEKEESVSFLYTSDQNGGPSGLGWIDGCFDFDSGAFLPTNYSDPVDISAVEINLNHPWENLPALMLYVDPITKPAPGTPDETPGDTDEKPSEDLGEELKSFYAENRPLVIIFGVGVFILVIALIATSGRRR